MTEKQDQSNLVFPVVGGIYKHYKSKGGLDHLYKVVGISRHTENHEYLVIYEGLYPVQWAIESKINFCARPLEMFMDKVIVNGEEKSRFELVSDPSKLDLDSKQS